MLKRTRFLNKIRKMVRCIENCPLDEKAIAALNYLEQKARQANQYDLRIKQKNRAWRKLYKEGKIIRKAKP